MKKIARPIGGEPAATWMQYIKDLETLLRETLEDWAGMPCETKGLEDMEGGCCRACRARDLLSEIKKPSAATTSPESEQFHRDWAEASSKPDYNKQEWIDRQRGLQARGIPA